MYNEYSRELGPGQFLEPLTVAWLWLIHALLLKQSVLGAKSNASPLSVPGGWNLPWVKKYTEENQSTRTGGEEIGQILTYLNKPSIYRPLNGCKLELTV